jgi:hypothetical protein
MYSTCCWQWIVSALIKDKETGNDETVILKLPRRCCCCCCFWGLSLSPPVADPAVVNSNLYFKNLTVTRSALGLIFSARSRTDRGPTSNGQGALATDIVAVLLSRQCKSNAEKVHVGRFQCSERPRCVCCFRFQRIIISAHHGNHFPQCGNLNVLLLQSLFTLRNLKPPSQSIIIIIIIILRPFSTSILLSVLLQRLLSAPLHGWFIFAWMLTKMIL